MPRAKLVVETLGSQWPTGSVYLADGSRIDPVGTDDGMFSLFPGRSRSDMGFAENLGHTIVMTDGGIRFVLLHNLDCSIEYRPSGDAPHDYRFKGNGRHIKCITCSALPDKNWYFVVYSSIMG